MSATVEFRGFADPVALEDAAVRLLTEAWSQPVAPAFGVMLTGGRTPLAVYARLAASPPVVAPGLHLLLSDERLVPPGHADHNFTHLEPLVKAMGLPAGRVLHPDTAQPPTEAASRYAAALSALVAHAPLPLGILGLGADGHLASLFTPTDVEAGNGLHAQVVTRASPPHRLSVTAGFLQRFERLVFLVSGSEKADIVRAWREAPDRVLAARVVARCRRVACWYCVD